MPSRENNGTHRDLASVGQCHTADLTVYDLEIIGLGFDHLQVWARADRALHRSRIKLPVGLGSRSADGWTFAAVQDAKLYSAQIGDPTHKPIQGIDLTDQMTFTQTANSRIAGHGSDGRKSVGDQDSSGAHTGGRSRSFTAGVAAANHSDVESDSHRYLRGRGCS